MGLIAGAGGGFTLPHSLKMSSARADELTKLQIVDAAIAIAVVANPRPIASSQVALALVRRTKSQTSKITARCETVAHSVLVPPHCVTGGVRPVDHAARGDACAVI
jgi:hypothetical protein